MKLIELRDITQKLIDGGADPSMVIYLEVREDDHALTEVSSLDIEDWNWEGETQEVSGLVIH